MHLSWKPVFGAAWLLAVIYVGITVVASPFHLLDDGHYSGISIKERTYTSWVVSEVEAGASGARAGLQVGDVLTQENMRSYSKWLPPSDPPLRLDVLRDQKRLSLTLPLDIRPIPLQLKVSRISIKITALACLIAALLIGFTRSGAGVYRWLAAAFLAIGIQWGTWPVAQLLPIEMTLAQILFPLALFFFFRFWFELSKASEIPTPRYWDLVSTLSPYLLSTTAVLALIFGPAPLFISLPIAGFEDPQQYPLINKLIGLPLFLILILYMLMCVAGPFRVIQKISAASANKIYWISAALLLFWFEDIAHFVLSILSMIFNFELSETSWYENYDLLISPLQPLCVIAFVYACIARRVISFDFIVNKTAVYVITASALILIFWLSKSYVDSLTSVDPDSRKTMINAAIALLVFIAKQFKGFADSAIKKLVFSKLGRREQELKRLIAQMGHFESAAALRLEFASRLSSFLHGARIEIFERGATSYIGLLNSAEIGADERLAVELRTRKAPVVGADLSANSEFRIVLPGLYRGSMVLFVALYESPELPTIRPDEIRLLEDAIRQFCTNIAFIELDERRQRDLNPQLM